MALENMFGALGLDATLQQIRDGLDPMRYYASLAGGRRAFNITTGIVTIAATGEQPLAVLDNPANSGKDAFLDLGEFGASANTTFRRIRNRTVTNLANPISGSNMGGGSEQSVLKMYAAPNYTQAADGAIAKTAHIAAFQQYVTELKGRVVLRPGQRLVWTITGPGGLGGSMTASVFFEYWELPAAA